MVIFKLLYLLAIYNILCLNYDIASRFARPGSFLGEVMASFFWLIVSVVLELVATALALVAGRCWRDASRNRAGTYMLVSLAVVFAALSFFTTPSIQEEMQFASLLGVNIFQTIIVYMIISTGFYVVVVMLIGYYVLSSAGIDRLYKIADSLSNPLKAPPPVDPPPTAKAPDSDPPSK